jgi:4-amino-4-deoxy-L-arabinose transferase-like glycosyltransferase
MSDVAPAQTSNGTDGSSPAGESDAMAGWWIYALVLLVLAGAGVRAWLVCTAAGINSDGPEYARVAQRMAQEGVGAGMRGDYMWPYNTVNTRLLVYPLLGSLVYRVTGDPVLSLRIVSAICGVALIPLAYLIGLELLSSTRAALAAAFVVGFEPEFARASAAVYREPTAAFFAAVAFYLFFRLLRDSRHRLWWAAAVGTVVFLGFMTRVEIVLLLVPFGLVAVWRVGGPWRRRLAVPLVMCAVFAVLEFPYYLWLHQTTGHHIFSAWQIHLIEPPHEAAVRFLERRAGP